MPRPEGDLYERPHWTGIGPLTARPGFGVHTEPAYTPNPGLPAKSTTPVMYNTLCRLRDPGPERPANCKADREPQKKTQTTKTQKDVGTGGLGEGWETVSATNFANEDQLHATSFGILGSAQVRLNSGALLTPATMRNEPKSVLEPRSHLGEASANKRLGHCGK